jgi:ABC-2 type transport system permease protein
MKALLLRELQSIFSSATGIFFSLAFLIAIGLILWFFPGGYNFIDVGYADMRPFFQLASILLLILVPALTMRLFSEEKRTKTLDVLLSRPVSVFSIYLSKFLATYILIIITLLPTVLYAWFLFQLANPTGNIDTGSIIASYISLLLISAVFVSIGLFGSALTKNQALAFILSLFLSFFVFYGFDLLSGIFANGKVQLHLSSFGLLHHYKSMQRGVIRIDNLVIIFIYIYLFYSLTSYSVSRRKMRISVILYVFSVILVFITSSYTSYKYDFTSDKRYTLSDETSYLLRQVSHEEALDVTLYLDGELNYGFEHLKMSVTDLISDFNKIANGNIILNLYNPYIGNELHLSDDMPGIILNEADKEGKLSKKVIYPYAQVSNGTDTLTISLLKNIMGYNAEENLNASIENLEFEFTDAIRLLYKKNTAEIAFIEGHDELSRAYVYDAEEQLSKYYTVNRGEIGNEVGILDQFAAIIIAGPLKEYSEDEKYVLDQYIMQGGKVLWLLDGTFYSHQDLAAKGYSASIKNNHNLDDILFSYGVRINADLIQDRQCVNTYLITDQETKTGIAVPSYFEPLLMPSGNHPVTKDIQEVKAGFASSIDIVNNSSDIKKEILLTSSADAHLVKVPDVIDFDIERIQNIPNYFNESFIPVAASLEGKFGSAFSNRAIPDSVLIDSRERMDKSKKTKMIAVSSSEIISNRIQNSQVLPMGYDLLSQIQYGNRGFIVNAINWLTDDDGLMQLRTKEQKLYLLNRKMAYENRDRYAIANTGLPILFIFVVFALVWLFRKRKYER